VSSLFQTLATWLLAAAFTVIWLGTAWLLATAPGVIAVAGLFYGVAALGFLLQIHSPDQSAKFEKDVADFRREIDAGGLRGVTFWLARPLFHLAILPSRSISAALLVAGLLAVPWLLVR
jgi:hypothetical protein